MPSYTVTCECCEQRKDVTAVMAGSTIQCGCGANIQVPNLSTLRSNAGETAIPQSTIDKIRRLIRDGEFPTTIQCPVSGHRADTLIYFTVECERARRRKGDFEGISGFFLTMLLGLTGTLLLRKPDVPDEEYGRDNFVAIPIMISSNCRSKLLKTRDQRKLREILQRIPPCGDMLKEFPEATITPTESG